MISWNDVVNVESTDIKWYDFHRGLPLTVKCGITWFYRDHYTIAASGCMQFCYSHSSRVSLDLGMKNFIEFHQSNRWKNLKKLHLTIATDTRTFQSNIWLSRFLSVRHFQEFKRSLVRIMSASKRTFLYWIGSLSCFRQILGWKPRGNTD